MTFPELTTPGESVALISPWTVSDREAVLVERAARERPAALLSLTMFYGIDETRGTTLNHARWRTAESCSAWFAPTGVRPPTYRVAGSYRGARQGDEPTMLATPLFTCDTAATQRELADAIVATLRELAPPGLVVAHLHCSLDGTRLVNCAEWTEHAAWAAFVTGEASTRMRETFATFPGVRMLNTPSGVARYQLAHRIKDPGLTSAPRRGRC